MFLNFSAHTNQTTKSRLYRESGAGFTIVEVLITVAIFSFLILITTSILDTVLFGSSQQFLALDNIDRARLTISHFVDEIRNASLGVDGSYQLGLAQDNEIVFYSTLANTSTVTRIHYYLSDTTLYRGVVAPSGSPAHYDPFDEITAIVQQDVVGDQPIFTYYDGNYDGSSDPLAQPVNVNLVKFVAMNLSVLHQVQRQSTDSFFIKAGAAMRNLKTNLGE